YKLNSKIENNKKPTDFSVGLHYAKRRPTLTGGSPQLPSALKSLTSVFGMGTGVTSLPSSLHLHMDVLASTLPQDVVLLVDVPYGFQYTKCLETLKKNFHSFKTG